MSTFADRIILFTGSRPGRRTTRGEITQRIGRRVDLKTRLRSLNILVRQGALEHKYGVPLGRTAGRPVHQYRLTQAGVRKYRKLCKQAEEGVL